MKVDEYLNLKNFAMSIFQNILDFFAAISEKAEFYLAYMKYPEELRKHILDHKRRFMCKQHD